MPATGFGNDMSLLMAIKAIKGQLLGTFVLTLLFGFSTRHDLVRVADRTLCKREFEERSHKRSLATWFFLTNFKDVIPKSMYIWYYTQLASWLILAAYIFALARSGASKEAIITACNLYIIVISVPVYAYWLFFMKREGNGNLVPRFISRRHVVTQKHTQQKKGKKHTQRKNRK